MKPKKHLLFIDDKPKVADAFLRIMEFNRHLWEIETAVSGEAALGRLAKDPFDVIVIDMGMTNTDARKLMNEIKSSYPWIIRISLFVGPTKDKLISPTGLIQLSLSKPDDVQHLKSTLARAYNLSNILSNTKLRSVVSSLETLPGRPSLYNELTRELQSLYPSAKEVGRIIEQDMAMSSKILRIVNSAMFSLPNQISSPTHAVNLLGLNTIKMLVLSNQLFSQFNVKNAAEFGLSGIWNHSLTVASNAKKIALTAGKDQKIAEDASIAGLLHDIGKLIYASNLPEDYKKVQELKQTENMNEPEAEYSIFGANHAHLGAYLLGLWGLPDAVIDAIAFHHEPASLSVSSFNALTAVHIANGFAKSHDLDDETFQDHLFDELNKEYFDKLGYDDQSLHNWRKAVVSENNQQEIRSI